MHLVLDRFPALGTAWWVEASLGDAVSEEVIKNKLIAHLNRFEARYSRFRNDSLIGQLNHDRSIKNPDEALISILKYGQSLYTRTGGAFNFLVGSTLIARGYGSGDIASTSTALPHPEHDLTISDNMITLHVGCVDFGGFGKGYVIDEIASLLHDNEIEEFVINGGGDIYATHDNHNPITIHLEHPIETNTYLGTTTLFHQGFAASSPYKRTWKHGEKAETHIVGETKYASFVKANNARDADAFATAVLLLDDTTIDTITTEADVGFARFHPITHELFTRNFAFTHLEESRVD